MCPPYSVFNTSNLEIVTMITLRQELCLKLLLLEPVKENGIWIPMSDVFDLGVSGPSGNENDTYVSNDIIYKVNALTEIMVSGRIAAQQCK